MLIYGIGTPLMVATSGIIAWFLIVLHGRLAGKPESESADDEQRQQAGEYMDLLIDDHARNAEDMANAGKTGVLILTHANHRKVPAHPNVKTASNMTGTPTERLVTDHNAQWNHVETIVKNENQRNEKVTA